MKEQVKTFLLEVGPGERGPKKDLAYLIDSAVNGFIGQDSIESADIIVAADLNGGYPKAVVTIKYLAKAKVGK